MIQKVQITFPGEAQPLCWDFKFSETNTLYDRSNLTGDFEEWMKLDFHKCSQCTLKSDKHPTCPVASALGRYARDLFHRHSTDMVNVQIWDNLGRQIDMGETPLQEVTGELVRLAVFQSECPIGRRVKKAVEFLPPFPTDQEITRTFALFFAMQQIRGNKEEAQELQTIFLKSLNELFENMSYRIRNITQGDASVNGVMIYHSLMMLVSLSLPETLENTIDEYSNW